MRSTDKLLHVMYRTSLRLLKRSGKPDVKAYKLNRVIAQGWEDNKSPESILMDVANMADKLADDMVPSKPPRRF